MKRAGRLSLRKFRYGISAESTAFSAWMYLDDVAVGTARNDGNGGESILWIDPAHRDAVDTWLSTCVPEWIVLDMSEGDGWTSRSAFPRSLDVITDLLVEGATFPEGFGQ